MYLSLSYSHRNKASYFWERDGAGNITRFSYVFREYEKDVEDKERSRVLEGRDLYFRSP
jgi:hypothetical protein